MAEFRWCCGATCRTLRRYLGRQQTNQLAHLIATIGISPVKVSNLPAQTVVGRKNCDQMKALGGSGGRIRTADTRIMIPLWSPGNAGNLATALHRRCIYFIPAKLDTDSTADR